MTTQSRQSFQLCRTVTSKGEFFFVDSKRVTRAQFSETKFMRRLDCFVTRATRFAVRDFMVATDLA